jgi:nitroreductase
VLVSGRDATRIGGQTAMTHVACPGASTVVAPDDQARPGDDAHAMSDLELWQKVIALATSAPSVHNVQPWRFRLTGDGLELHMADEIVASDVDATMRTVTISCGVVLHHLRVALRAAGRTPIVELVSEPGPSALLAVIRLGEPYVPTHEDGLRAAAITLRHTQREAFDDRPLRGELLDRLAVAAADEGGFLDVLRGDRRDAVCELLSTPDLALAQQAPALAVLSAAGDGLHDQLEAGQALSAVVLEAASESCWAGFLDAPLQDACSRARLHDLIVRGEVPMLLLRVGHADAAPQTSRLPVDEVLQADRPSTSTPSHGVLT